ncbi:hypothetical protein BDW22DRAFT_1047662 [Trametopsis cervina]|nr:hypothetical protein BDW22DRAFT_1047662 [Trametopsis cervina]
MQVLLTQCTAIRGVPSSIPNAGLSVIQLSIIDSGYIILCHILQRQKANHCPPKQNRASPQPRTSLDNSMAHEHEEGINTSYRAGELTFQEWCRRLHVSRMAVDSPRNMRLDRYGIYKVRVRYLATRAHNECMHLKSIPPESTVERPHSSHR